MEAWSICGGLEYLCRARVFVEDWSICGGLEYLWRAGVFVEG